MSRTPPLTARDMNIPSHIGPHGYSPIRSPTEDKNGSFSSEHSDGAIELATPPKVIKLDDSNIWGAPPPSGHQKPEQSPLREPLQSYDSINDQFFDGELDSTDEVDKLRRQMYKVNRRLNKLEKLDEQKSSQIMSLKVTTAISIALAVITTTFQLFRK